MGVVNSKVVKRIVDVIGTFGDSIIEKGCLVVLYQPRAYKRGEFRETKEETSVGNDR